MLPSDVECMHPARHMGYHADLRKSSRNPQNSRAVKDKVSSARADQSTRLHDQLKFEKPISKPYSDLPYSDLHREVKETLGDGPLFARRSLGTYQKQSVERKAKQDELVKHMSNLPRYLQRVEKGENLQEKVLNFGVLDWGRLENWKYNQKPVTHRSIMHSPSTSNTSSPFSTVGSSTLSTTSDSGIPGHRKQSPSQGVPLASSSKYSDSMVLMPPRENVASVQEKITVIKNTSVGQQKLPGTNVCSQKNQSRMKFEKGMKNDMNSKFIKENGISSSSSNSCEVSSPKGKTKVPEGGYIQKTERFQESTSAGQHCPGRDKTIVLLLPKHLSNKRLSGPSRTAEFTTLSDSKQTETCRSSFSDGFCIDGEVQFSDLCSDIPRSCPQLSGTEPSKQSDMNLPRSVAAPGSKAPYVVPHSIPHSGEIENKVTTKPTDLMVTAHIKVPGLKTEDPLPARFGNQSPNRWPSVGKGKISRSLSFKEGSALPQLSSTYVTTKSGPVESDSFSDISNRDKSTTNSRARSSPLRRLLDPLLRPKTANRLTTREPLHDDGRTVCKSSDRLLASSVQPAKRGISISGSISIDANGAQQDEKHGVSMVQALLQVTVKNGLPWFTFAVDSNSDILAATMRKTSSSEKYDCSWIYTFYSFRKAKKKSGGWMGNGSKSRNRDYVPNVVGQMKVNGPRCPKSTKHDSKVQHTVREFVLLEVEPKKADQEISNLVVAVELAAIVIRVPSEITGSLTSDRHQSKHEDVPILPSIVVVLPSGVHGLPATGLPSPLLNRWKSGGSCDCGGWDEGCQLRVLSNQEEHNKDIDKFDLLVQCGGYQGSIPHLSFATYDKGVHSIDFNASISSLQAFSICIAFLHCKNLAKVSNMLFHEPISMESERVKLSAQIDGEAPSSCAPFPPPSPVGRV